MAKERQVELPGLENRKLKDLHETALTYAEKRDERQALLTEEVDLKQRLLTLLKKYKMDHYEYNGVTVDRVMEEETVRVRIKSKDKDEAA